MPNTASHMSRRAFILRPSWNSACLTPAFILMGMCGRNAHKKTAPRVTCEPRETCDPEMVALPRASAFTLAAVPRGAWLFSCLRGLPTPGSLCGRCTGYGCAKGPVYLRRCTFTARASADARLPPFIDLSAALKSIAVFVFHGADSRLSSYRCASSGS